MDGNTRNERMNNDIAERGIWKLRETRGGCKKGSYPLSLEKRILNIRS